MQKIKKKIVLTLSMVLLMSLTTGCSIGKTFLQEIKNEIHKEEKGNYKYVFDSGYTLDKISIMGEWVAIEEDSLFDFGYDEILNWYKTSDKDENNIQGGKFEVIPLKQVKDYKPSSTTGKNESLDNLPVIRFSHDKMIMDGVDLKSKMVLTETNFVVENFDYDTMTITNLNTYNTYKLTRK